ncbi:hypothetical protein DFH28DRAFT_881343, partial [Melampsora americana]
PIKNKLQQVLFVQVGLSILASTSVSPTYNLPIHLYGLYNLDQDSNSFSLFLLLLLKYSILLVMSFGLDLIWMYNWSNSISSLPFLLILIGLIIKPITLINCLNQLQLHPNHGFGQPFGAFLQQPTTSNVQPNRSSHQVSPNQSRGFQRDPKGSLHSSNPISNQPFSRPGPSSVSHQAQSSHLIHPTTTQTQTQTQSEAYHEFDLDSDAQNLSDDDLRLAQKKLENRIAQKEFTQFCFITRSVTLNQSSQSLNRISFCSIVYFIKFKFKFKFNLKFNLNSN